MPNCRFGDLKRYSVDENFLKKSQFGIQFANADVEIGMHRILHRLVLESAVFLGENVEVNDPYGVRTRVAGVKGRSPRPLDEGAAEFQQVNIQS